jgi:hypothetical protein
MSNDLFVAFSTPPDSFDLDKFNAFQEEHIREVLEVPGFESARRYELRRTGGNEYPAQYTFVTIYGIDGPKDDVFSAMRATRDRRAHPDWYEEVPKSGQMAEWIEGDGAPTTRDQLYLVFSTPPAAMSSHAYDEWYRQHLEENVRNSQHIHGGWRYRLGGGSVVDGEVPEHFAIYALEGSAEEMLKETRAGHEKDGSPPLQGFRSFASFDAHALAGRVTADG